ncbi:MAG TPA: hypothetical protein DCZ92_14390 [Elusimicrobia bacterium]|nr:MAG: hypothetical protein A2016_08980 [Elusimicrobia bacterium GWF2_62_30]HBA61972.1 hypothetical protein [Elusimicrobiota bacterium]
MNDTSADGEFSRTYVLPYLLGVYLAANAVKDVCVVVDGPDCIMQKADLIWGNHDLFSTLLSGEGRHRILCTMAHPVSSDRSPDTKITTLVGKVAASGQFGAVVLTALPFSRISGVDYAGIAAAASARTPVAYVPAKSLELDWLDGYDETLAALARSLPAPRKAIKRRRAVVLAGYMLDRNEFDHSANLAELRRLLAAAGLETVSVWPSGGDCAELARAAQAGLVVSLPHGRKTAKALSERFGAPLVETGLPLGLQGTLDWLRTITRAAGLRGELPVALREEARRTAAVIAPALPALLHKNILFTGDPGLYSALASFAEELCMDASCALLNTRRRPVRTAGTPAVMLFGPEIPAARAAVQALPAYQKPHLAVGDSFALSEGLNCGLPFMEFGFPSYAHHCLTDEPFLGFSGARSLAARLLNCLHSG